MGKRIMVVDDSADVRWTTCFILRQAGYELIEATDGAEALSKLDNERLDAIVTDLHMPRVDGIGVVKGVRSHVTHAFLPIIMVSAFPGDSKVKEGDAAGITAWVFKPYKPAQLLSALEKVFS